MLSRIPKAAGAGGPAHTQGAPIAPADEVELLATIFAVAPCWTRPQLQAWFTRDSDVTLCRRLKRLTDRGVLARRRLTATQGSGPYAYAVGRAGRVLLSGARACPRGDSSSTRLEGDLYHSLGIANFYVQLDQALRLIDGEILAWWGEAAAICPVGPNERAYVNPDAAILIAHDHEQLCLLEYDRAPDAAGITAFMAKLARYRRYYERRAYRDHLGTGHLRPILLCLFADRARMERVRRRTTALLAATHRSSPTILFGGTEAAMRPTDPVWYRPEQDEPLTLLDARLA
jgi:hypothetical protein